MFVNLEDIILEETGWSKDPSGKDNHEELGLGIQHLNFMQTTNRVLPSISGATDKTSSNMSSLDSKNGRKSL